MLQVDSAAELGTWASFATYDKEGKVAKTRNCGVVVLKRWPQREEANKAVILQHMKSSE